MSLSSSRGKRNLSCTVISSENKDNNEFHSLYYQSMCASKNQLDSILLASTESLLNDANPAARAASPNYLNEIITKQLQEIDLSKVTNEKD